MKFSLLMPTKNRPQLLQKALKHILHQSHENFEAVIVDDGARRNEDVYALSLKDKRINYIWRNGAGIASAMNDALRASTGDVFNWHNDDDFIGKHTLRFVAEQMGAAQWCYGRIVTMNKYHIPIGLMGRAFDFELEKRQNIIPQPAVFWSRKSFETIGFFDESIDHVTDHDYWLRLGAHYQPAFFRRIFAYYLVHDNMGSKVFFDQKVVQWEVLKAKHRNVSPAYLNKP